MHLCAVVGPLRPPLPARYCPSGSPAFCPGCLSGRARRCPRAPCVCPKLTSALPLRRRPAPSPPVSPSHPYAPPTRCHPEGCRLPSPVCTFLSAVSACAVHSPVFGTRGFHLCPFLMSQPFPPELGRTLTLSSLRCYRPQASCYACKPRLPPLPGHHRFTAKGSINMQTGMPSCMWMGKMMGRHLLRPARLNRPWGLRKQKSDPCRACTSSGHPSSTSPPDVLHRPLSVSTPR